MRYIITAGTGSDKWHIPRQLTKINGEILIERTIRLLRQAGVDDIAITSMDDRFAEFDIPLIKYDSCRQWLDIFYITEEPTCYIFGDVYFSPEAIEKIVNTETNDIEFFASAPPFDVTYTREWAEPFAFKVVDVEKFKKCVNIAKRLDAERKFKRTPAISWELWQVIKGTRLNVIDYTNYTVINDYTVDIDNPEDAIRLNNKLIEIESDKTVKYMIHTCPDRLWYVKDYLMSSMKEQGCENIEIYNDEKGQGSLRSYINSFLELSDDGGTWHLQDDVIISSGFKKLTEKYNNGIVCGFSSRMYDGNKPYDVVGVKDKWFSFPCIRIPNKIAIECAEWTNKYIIGNAVYKNFWGNGRNEDWIFWQFINDNYKDMKIRNLNPNIVDHVDYIIGGSTGSDRKDICRSRYWNEEHLVQRLKEELVKRE